MITSIDKADNVIIIVNYNGSSDTIMCFDSIKASESESAVIIIDNNSSTFDFNKILEFCNGALIKRLDINKGFAGGNNLGIKIALEYKNIESLIFLNNDTVIKSNSISALLHSLSDGIIVSPKMKYYNDSDRLWYDGGYFNKYTGRAIHRHMGELDNGENNAEKNNNFTSGCCFAITRKDIINIGEFDETYFMYCEDTEFCLRALKYGLRIRYEPLSIIYHKVSQSTGGGESSFCLYYMTRNRLRYLHDYNNFFYLTAIPFTLITRYIRILQLIIKKDDRWKAIKCGINDYYKGIRGKRVGL